MDSYRIKAMILRNLPEERFFWKLSAGIPERGTGDFLKIKRCGKINTVSSLFLVPRMFMLLSGILLQTFLLAQNGIFLSKNTDAVIY
jgi:hypothetical protein